MRGRFQSQAFGLNHKQFTRFCFRRGSPHCHVRSYVNSQPGSLDYRFVSPHHIVSVPSRSDCMEFEAI
jgi:hypothetical protein